MATVYLDPVNRIEGHMGVEIVTAGTVPTMTVGTAKVQGQMYRGFENILHLKPVQDCITITQRI